MNVIILKYSKGYRERKNKQGFRDMSKSQCLTMSNSIFFNNHLGLWLWAQASQSVNVHMFFTYQRQITQIKQDNNIIIVSYNTIVSTEWHGQL